MADSNDVPLGPSPSRRRSPQPCGRVQPITDSRAPTRRNFSRMPWSGFTTSMIVPSRDAPLTPGTSTSRGAATPPAAPHCRASPAATAEAGAQLATHCSPDGVDSQEPLPPENSANPRDLLGARDLGSRGLGLLGAHGPGSYGPGRSSTLRRPLRRRPHSLQPLRGTPAALPPFQASPAAADIAPAATRWPVSGVSRL